MLNFINVAVPVIGSAIMFYILLSKRFDTRCAEYGAFFNLSMALWVLLFWADFTADFQPVWQTVSARLIVIVMVLCIAKRAWRTKGNKKPVNNNIGRKNE